MNKEITSSISVVVPCYNERGAVDGLMNRIVESVPKAQIIVIDDGSTDGSAAVIEAIQTELDLTLIKRHTNGGKGAAVREGLLRATREWVVIQDADLEYDPADLVTMLQTAIDEDLDAIYGSRYLNRRGPVGQLSHWLGVKLLAWVIWFRFGVWMTDPCTCYKMFKRKWLLQHLPQSNGFELCQELNRNLCSDRSLRWKEIPIGYQPRTRAQGKKIRARDFWRSLREILKVNRRQESVNFSFNR